MENVAPKMGESKQAEFLQVRRVLKAVGDLPAGSRGKNYQKTHRRKDSWELHVKIEVRKSLANAGLESKTRGCKLPGKGTMDNSYTGVQLFCMLASNSLINIYAGCNETKV